MNDRRYILIEDEPRAAKRLQRLVSELQSDWQLLGQADTVESAIALMKAHPNADLAFCDIQLADGLSFEALEQAKPKLPIVFVTAYDHYAIRAFEHFSIDYLLKPITEEALERAISKLQRSWQESVNPVQADDLQYLLQHLQQGTRTYKERYLVRIGDKLRFFNIQNIRCFYSEDKTTYLLNTEGRSYPIDRPLEEIASEVDPVRYFRINRKFMVSPDAIQEISAWSNSRLRLVLKGMEEEMVVVAREKTGDFKEWLDR